MPNLENYGKTEFTVTCSKVEVSTLEKLFKTDEQKQAFLDAIKRFPNNCVTKEQKEKYKSSRIKRDGLVIYYTLADGSERYEFMILPKETGYGNSSLKKFIETNQLPMDTDKWKGLALKCRLDETTNFPRLVR